MASDTGWTWVKPVLKANCITSQYFWLVDVFYYSKSSHLLQIHLYQNLCNLCRGVSRFIHLLYNFLNFPNICVNVTLKMFPALLHKCPVVPFNHFSKNEVCADITCMGGMMKACNENGFPLMERSRDSGL